MSKQRRKSQPIARSGFIREFGSRVRQARVQAGLKQAELARAARLSVAYMARVELGQTECGIELASRIASALGIGVRELFPSEKPDRPRASGELARRRLESILSSGDQQALGLLVPVLTLLEESAGRRRRRA